MAKCTGSLHLVMQFVALHCLRPQVACHGAALPHRVRHPHTAAPHATKACCRNTQHATRKLRRPSLCVCVPQTATGCIDFPSPGPTCVAAAGGGSGVQAKGPVTSFDFGISLLFLKVSRTFVMKKITLRGPKLPRSSHPIGSVSVSFLYQMTEIERHLTFECTPRP